MGNWKCDVLIVGAGLAGLAAKKYLDEQGVDSLVVESLDSMGGHAKTSDLLGYKFDQGPHILFGKDEQLLDFAGAPAASTFSRNAVVGNRWNGVFLSQPAQMDFAHLPDEETRNRVAKSIIEASLLGSPETATNYREWLDATQGPLVRREFTEKYTRKYWRLSTENLGTDWVAGRIHSASQNQNEMISRHLQESTLADLDLTKESYYLTKYAYSAQGFWHLFKDFHALEVKFDSAVVDVDLNSKTAFTNSGSVTYKRMISTIPLTRLASISGVDKGLDLSELKVTSFVCTNFVLKSKTGLQHDYQWLYLYDENQPVSRICFPTRFSEADERSTTFTMQTESYFLKPDEIAPLQNPEEIVAYMKQESILPEDAELEASAIEIFDFANIVPTPNRARLAGNLERIFLENGVHLAGRFGRWEYLWSLDSVRSGIEAGQKALSALKEEGNPAC